jgi:hypothetical protein
MEVFVVPVAADRYELYCEVSDHPAPETGAARPGIAGRLTQRFARMVADAEQEQRHPPSEPGEGGARRIGRWVLRRVAGTIAEQRLLWHLRGQREATLVHPDDLTAGEAFSILKLALGRDRDRHRFWLAGDGALAAVTGPLFFFVPGPNLVAYYFVFRAVGHYFAWRGARQGLDRVDWRAESHAALTELRAALTLPAADRERRVRDLAGRLRLQHLSAFFERVVVSPS